MTLAFLYAGQGSQRPGMGMDFYEEYPQIRHLFDMTPLGVGIKDLCFGQDEQALADTRNTQPCMGAFGAAVTALLRQAGVVPRYAAGLSLGEYGALHAAGVFSARQYIELLAIRGAAMAEAAQGISCAMTAVFALPEDEINRAIADVGGQVWCCNFNCPGQIVIGGLAQDVAEAARLCLERGAKRCVPLNVSGPFHTPLMEPAAQRLEAYLESQEPGAMEIPVIFNTTGDLLAPGTTIAQMLVRQIKAPVRLEESIRRLEALGVDTIVEIGPGKAMAGFVRKTAPKIAVHSIDSCAGLEAALAVLGAKG